MGEARPNPWFTAVLALLVAGALVFSLYPAATTEGPSGLRFVGESAGRKADRHLYFYGGYENVPAWERAMHRMLFGPRDAVEKQSIDIYAETLEWFARNPDRTRPWNVQNTRARWLIALAETGQIEAFAEGLEVLGVGPEEDVLRATLAYAYGVEGETLTPAELRYGARMVPGGWGRDHLRMRLAERAGDMETADAFRVALALRGQEMRDRLRWLAAFVAATLGLGVILLLRRRVFTHPPPWRAAVLEEPWHAGQGFAVIVRAALYAILIALGLSLFQQHYFRPGILSMWSTLVVALPMLWLIHRHLLRPRGIGYVQAFGLTLRGVGVRAFAAVTLAVICIQWGGNMLISWLGWAAGLEGHWSQGIHELAYFGSLRNALLTATNVVVWAAVIEEIAFRGLIYVTLRSVMRPWMAIVLSAALFSGLHLYSLVAMLSVFWSGLVLAWSFERFRSLLPAMVAHGIGNALAVSTLMLFYR
ncbi:CAAX protease family protein [Thioalkalivibrio denitrificans]|uniref:CAAX protease family protein n=1 Tax=Thioalkalivibrio denitrificans TaxID=108003 RepID=A0A1V3NEH1_9GAMM|nr:type II CAAX endopeptidase family protein [Thioalkalivibrio denitrificans]OOG23252.1 CAAX protease family protein [Thioalkalivibrio denitrificans]